MSQRIGASKYSPEQREAVVFALVDSGMTLRECMARAQAGQLVTRPGKPVGEFRLPQATAALWARVEREQRELSRNGPLHRQVPAQAIDELRSRLLRLVEKKITRLELQANPDLEEIKQAAAAGAQIKRLLPEAPKVAPNAPGQKASETPFLDGLVRKTAGKSS